MLGVNGADYTGIQNAKENGMQVLIAFLEGNKDQIAAFQEFANENKPEYAEVSDSVFEDYEGYVIGIADYMHLIQVEHLSKGIPAIVSIDRKQDKMLEKQDKMLEKQDLQLKITERGFADVKEEVSLLRDDFRELFML